ncbi:MAG: hypothetical protein ACLQCB_07180 [Spirochaetia bacterium]
MQSSLTAQRAGFSLPWVTLFASLFLVAAASASWSDFLDDWYRSDPHAAAYSDVRGELSQIFAQAARQHVPQRLLLNKMREGEAKGVPSDKLVSTLGSELGLLSRAWLIVERAGFGGSFLSPVADETVKDVEVFLRSGLPDQLVGGLLSASATRHAGKEAALAACGAIMDLRAVAPMEDADSLQIGKLLVASGLPPSGYASLALVYGLGMSRGLSHDAVVHEVIINTLSSGGGLAIMNQKIVSTPISETLAPAPPAQLAKPPKHPAPRGPGPGKKINKR